MNEEPNEGTVEAAERLTFPPFPVPPPGATIISFKNFVAQGLTIDAAGASFHGDGTPTVALEIVHSVDGAAKGGKKKNKKRKKGGAVMLSGDRRLTWSEIWAEADAKVVRPMADSRPESDSSAADILSTAAYEFEKSRPWPQEAGLRQMWDQMKIYMGILYQPKVSKGLPDDMDDSDDEEGFEAAVAAAAQQETPTAEPEPLQPSLVEFDENTAAVPSASIVNRDERLMQAFADDPETNVKIMLSSWFREKGMIWSKEKCRDGPKLLSFFLNFIIRAKLFSPDTPWKKSLAISHTGEKELPLTNAIVDALPGEFSKACVAEFGGAKEYTQYWSSALEEDNAPNADLPVGVTEIVPPEDTQAAHAGWGDSTDTLAPDAAATGPGWAASIATHDDSGWGAVDAAADPWTATESSGWGAKVDADVSWGTEKVPTLGELPGTAALARTHARGIVEQSTRRIAAVVPPNADLAACATPVEDMTAEEVERELDRCFAKVTFAPWGWWDGRDGSSVHYPEILSTSKGAVVVDGRVAGGTESSGLTDPDATPFHPCEDTITVLASAKNLETIGIGLGPSAIFDQLVRKDGRPSGFWYMEDMVAVVPSYYWLKSDE